MAPVPPLKSVSEEIEDLVKACDSLENLCELESLTEERLRRVGRALMQRTVQRLADQESSGTAPEDFSPSGG